MPTGYLPLPELSGKCSDLVPHLLVLRITWPKSLQLSKQPLTVCTVWRWRYPCQQDVATFYCQAVSFCCIGVVIALGPQLNIPSLFFSPSMCTHSLTSHYFVNGGWFESDNYLIDNVDPIRHIPATIVQGRYDIVTPMKTAWDLHKVQPCTHPWKFT